MEITAFNIAGSPQGQATSSDGLGRRGTVTAVTINAAGTKVETASRSGLHRARSATRRRRIVGGLNAGDRVEWTTTALHDQVLIEGVAGKFDIGGFGDHAGPADARPEARLRRQGHRRRRRLQHRGLLDRHRRHRHLRRRHRRRRRRVVGQHAVLVRPDQAGADEVEELLA